jgi:hypothetical protein
VSRVAPTEKEMMRYRSDDLCPEKFFIIEVGVELKKVSRVGVVGSAVGV